MQVDGTKPRTAQRLVERSGVTTAEWEIERGRSDLQNVDLR